MKREGSIHSLNFAIPSQVGHKWRNEDEMKAKKTRKRKTKENRDIEGKGKETWSKGEEAA